MKIFWIIILLEFTNVQLSKLQHQQQTDSPKKREVLVVSRVYSYEDWLRQSPIGRQVLSSLRFNDKQHTGQQLDDETFNNIFQNVHLINSQKLDSNNNQIQESVETTHSATVATQSLIDTTQPGTDTTLPTTDTTASTPPATDILLPIKDTTQFAADTTSPPATDPTKSMKTVTTKPETNKTHLEVITTTSPSMRGIFTSKTARSGGLFFKASNAVTPS